MKKRDYKNHFLMDNDSVIEFVKDTMDIFDEDSILTSEEIGDGNINYVFKIIDKKTGKSVVVKQADTLLRASGRPLDLHRNKIEAEILKIQNELAPGFVPEVIDYNEDMAALTMEDISEYKNMRYELSQCKIFPMFSEQISSFLAKTLLPTTDLVKDRHQKKEAVKLFVNVDLCDISEDLVFTEPYYNYKNRNIITEGLEIFVEDELYNDEKLKSEVAYLRNNFMNNAQSLIHGDLHTGSIFINEKGIKVIDPEFAFYGPMGYDIGNVIGNLFFSYAVKHIENKCSDYLNWLDKSIVEIFDMTKEKLLKEYDKNVKLPIYNSIFRDEYIDKVVEDSIGYAGTEIIRRTVGDSKVMELNKINDLEIRRKVDKILVLLGKNMILNRKNIRKGIELTEMFRKVCE